MIGHSLSPAMPASTGATTAERLRHWARSSSAEGPPFTRGQRIALLLGFAALVILRLPRAWLHGRFLDEEGTIFFAYAWHRPAMEALLRPFAGYLNLGANSMTLLAASLVRAGALPLERAPWLTMAAALLVQLVPAVLVLTGRAGWLATRWTIPAALLVLAISPMTEEVFANTLHIQFQLAMAAALILALDTPRSWAGWAGHAAVLLLAPLCGPGAIVLLPLFVLRAGMDRDPARLVQGAILAAGAALQLLVFFSRSPVRGHLLDPATLASVLFVRLVALPFIGPVFANGLGKGIHASNAAATIWWWAAVVLAIAYFAWLGRVAVRRPRDGTIWLILSGLAFGAVSFGGGMIDVDSREWFSTGAGERYNFLPLVLLTLALVALAARPGGEGRRTFLALCVLSLVSGVVAYPQPLTELSRGPVWANEVARWRQHPEQSPSGWQQGWTVDLSDGHRACSPLGPYAAAASEPDYCEASWRARIARRPSGPPLPAPRAGH